MAVRNKGAWKQTREGKNYLRLLGEGGGNRNYLINEKGKMR